MSAIDEGTSGSATTGVPGPVRDHQSENASPAANRACVSGCRLACGHGRILVTGDALEHVQVDAGVGHPCQRGVPQSVADQSWESEVADEFVPAGCVAKGRRRNDTTARSHD